MKLKFWYRDWDSINKFLKFVWINMNAMLMMSPKLAIPDLFKITVLWSKDYDVTISVYEVIIKILLRDSNYIVNVILWPKFGNCSISTRELIIALILIGLDWKSSFWKRWPCFESNNLGIRYKLWPWNFTQCCKRR